MARNNRKVDIAIVRSVLDSLPLGVFVLNAEREIRWMNARLVQYMEKERGGQSTDVHCYAKIFDLQVPCRQCPAIKTLKTGRTEHAKIKIEENGEIKYYRITATPLQKEGRDMQPLIIETIQDITYQKKSEEDLRHLNDFNAAIIENTPVAIFTINPKGRFISINPALAMLSGLGTEAEGKLLGFNWLKNPYTVQCGLANYIKKGLEGEPFELQDFPFISYRGDRDQYIHFRGVPLRDQDGKVTGLLCIIEDNTEKVKARIQLVQDAKMSVIGRLTTGVAHELNNPLATIAANSELACELFQSCQDSATREKAMAELQEHLEVIQEQAFRCKNIIKDMIDLTRKNGFEVQKINLNECVDDFLKLINFEKLGVRLVKDIASNLPCVRGDLNALKQCFVNILQNALDSMEGRRQPTLRIRVLHVGSSVKVEFEDNGVGIHRSLVDKIFDPFFSTKDAGKGVGLGLTLCYEFLSRMGGNIEVESTLAKGSLFKVTLPLYMSEAVGEQ